MSAPARGAQMHGLYLDIPRADGRGDAEFVAHVKFGGGGHDGNDLVSGSVPSARLKEDDFSWLTNAAVASWTNVSQKASASNQALVDSKGPHPDERRFVFELRVACTNLTCTCTTRPKTCNEALDGFRDYLCGRRPDGRRTAPKGAMLRSATNVREAVAELLPSHPSTPDGPIRVLLSYRGSLTPKAQKAVRERQAAAARQATAERQAAAVAAEKERKKEARKEDVRKEEARKKQQQQQRAREAQRAEAAKAKVKEREMSEKAAATAAAAKKREDALNKQLAEQKAAQTAAEHKAAQAAAEKLQRVEDEKAAESAMAKEAAEQQAADLKRQMEEIQAKARSDASAAAVAAAANQAKSEAATAAAIAAATTATTAVQQLLQQRQSLSSLPIQLDLQPTGSPSAWKSPTATPPGPVASPAGGAARDTGKNALDIYRQSHSKWVLGGFAELIHNAADAKASELRIDYEPNQGGRILLRDDGIGMTRKYMYTNNL